MPILSRRLGQDLNLLLLAQGERLDRAIALDALISSAPSRPASASPPPSAASRTDAAPPSHASDFQSPFAQPCPVRHLEDMLPPAPPADVFPLPDDAQPFRRAFSDEGPSQWRESSHSISRVSSHGEGNLLASSRSTVASSEAAEQVASPPPLRYRGTSPVRKFPPP